MKKYFKVISILLFVKTSSNLLIFVFFIWSMAMKSMASTILLLVISAICFGQKPVQQTKIDSQQTIVKKRIIINDLENQIKDISFVAVRSFVRYKIAAWLWQNGKDETNEAESFAVKAIDEMYERKNEVPSLYFDSSNTGTLALLEINAPKTAEKLRKKYEVTSDDDLKTANSLLDTKNGEKSAVEKLRKSLVNQTEFPTMTTWLLEELKSRKSPELVSVLTDVVSLQESGQSNFSANALFSVVDSFRSSIVPIDLRIRFYRIVLNKARAGIGNEESDEAEYNLLSAVIDDISKNALNFLAEASALKATLSNQVDRAKLKLSEIYDRIERSPDRLSALISEAEGTDDESLKEELFTQAAQLALKKNKFRLAIDLLEKTNPDEKEIQKNPRAWAYHDQFLGDVSTESLKKDDTESSKYASDKIVDKLTRAAILQKTAVYFFGKKDLSSAIEILGASFKLSSDSDNDIRKVRNLIRLIPAFQKIDKARISEVTEKTAKAIDAIPLPDVEDKSESENYKNYVGLIMATNYNLLPVMQFLVKENKNEAINFANRLNKREVKIIANYTLLTDSPNMQTEPKK